MRSLTRGSRRSARADRNIRFPSRTSNTSPSACLRRERAALVAGWVRLNCLAAAVSLQRSSRACSSRSRLRSKVLIFTGPIPSIQDIDLIVGSARGTGKWGPAIGADMMELYEFDCEGNRLVGNLHLPQGEAHGVAILTGPLTSVKEQATGTWGHALAERGFVALAFDHRHFGESAGRPRQ